MSNIIDLSLSELVSNIRNKKISSNEATSTFVDRSKKSKHLNSYNEETFETALKNEEVEKTFEINSPDSVDFDKIPAAVYCFKEEWQTPYKIMDITHNGNSMILFDKKWMAEDNSLI